MTEASGGRSVGRAKLLLSQKEPKSSWRIQPRGNLDDENARKVMALLLELSAEEGSALVYVTHSEEMAKLA